MNFSLNDPPEMCAVLPLEGENLSYIRLKFSGQIKRRALIDAGSCANALPESVFNDINLTNPKSLTLEKPYIYSVRMASGQRLPVDKQAKVSFQIGLHHFQDSFLILLTMTSVILGNPFFKKHNIKIDPKNNLLQIPDITVQLNQILPEKGEKRYYTKKIPKIPLIWTKKIQIAPQSQVLLECSLAKLSDQFQSCTRLVIPSDLLEGKCCIALTSSLSKIDDTGKVFVSTITLSDNQVTLNNQTAITNFEVLNETQADNLIEIDPQLISLAKMRNPDDFEGELNLLIQDFNFKKIDTSTGRPPPDYSKLWFPAPETLMIFPI